MNPYEVLGVSENATSEQIRAAYLSLVKKYHPDRYQDNPLKDLATEKLKEVNEAYAMLNSKSRSGSSASGGSYSSTGGGSSRSSSYTGQYSAEFARARSLLNSQNLQAAAAVLDGIPLHNAEWHYLYGIIFFRSARYSEAYDYLSRAASMEPGNSEYRQAFNMMQSRGSRGYGGGFSGDPQTRTACNLCSSLLCADCCCECMGGDLIRCC